MPLVRSLLLYQGLCRARAITGRRENVSTDIRRGQRLPEWRVAGAEENGENRGRRKKCWCRPRRLRVRANAVPPLVSDTMQSEMHPELAKLSFLLGRWEGLGVAGYPDTEEFQFTQVIEFTHDGHPHLNYRSQVWRVNEDGSRGEPVTSESGYWRVRTGKAAQQEDPDQPPIHVEVLISHPEGTARSTSARFSLTGWSCTRMWWSARRRGFLRRPATGCTGCSGTTGRRWLRLGSGGQQQRTAAVHVRPVAAGRPQVVRSGLGRTLGFLQRRLGPVGQGWPPEGPGVHRGFASAIRGVALAGEHLACPQRAHFVDHLLSRVPSTVRAGTGAGQTFFRGYSGNGEVSAPPSCGGDIGSQV